MQLPYHFFFQAEDGIRDSVASRGLGDVYKRQTLLNFRNRAAVKVIPALLTPGISCLLYTSDAADE